VYVDAFVPDQDESITTLIGAGSFITPALTDPASVFNLAPYPDAPAGQVDTYVKTDLFISKFACATTPSRRTRRRRRPPGRTPGLSRSTPDTSA
jgi:hypothetical protein